MKTPHLSMSPKTNQQKSLGQVEKSVEKEDGVAGSPVRWVGLLCDPYFLCTHGPLSQEQFLPGAQATSLRGSEDLLGARQLMPVSEDTATLEHMHAQPFSCSGLGAGAPDALLEPRGFSLASLASPSDPTRTTLAQFPAVAKCPPSPPVPLHACSSPTWQM